MDDGDIHSIDGQRRDEGFIVMQRMSIVDSRSKIMAWRLDYKDNVDRIDGT